MEPMEPEEVSDEKHEVYTLVTLFLYLLNVIVVNKKGLSQKASCFLNVKVHHFFLYLSYSIPPHILEFILFLSELI